MCDVFVMVFWVINLYCGFSGFFVRVWVKVCVIIKFRWFFWFWCVAFNVICCLVMGVSLVGNIIIKLIRFCNNFFGIWNIFSVRKVFMVLFVFVWVKLKLDSWLFINLEVLVGLCNCCLNIFILVYNDCRCEIFRFWEDLIFLKFISVLELKCFRFGFSLW